MKQLFSVLFFAVFFTGPLQQAFAQKEQYKAMESTDDTSGVTKVKADKKWDWSRARIGGTFGLQFGNTVYIDISPSFGYYVLENKLLVGLGFKNIFYNQKDSYYYSYNGNNYYSPAYKTYLYGPSFFVQYNIWKGLMAHGEYELINKEPYYPQGKPDRINVSHLLLGAGYNQPIGKAGNFYISMLYNVLDNEESIYEGTFGNNVPIILRMGFGFGFGGN